MIGLDCRRSQTSSIRYCTRSSSENAGDLRFIWRIRINHSARGKYYLRARDEEDCGLRIRGNTVFSRSSGSGRGGGNAECGFRIAEWGSGKRECGLGISDCGMRSWEQGGGNADLGFRIAEWGVNHGPRESAMAKRTQTPRNTKAENMKRPKSKVQMRRVANTPGWRPRSRKAYWPSKAILYLTQRPGSGWRRLGEGVIGVGRRLPGFRAATGPWDCEGGVWQDVQPAPWSSGTGIPTTGYRLLDPGYCYKSSGATALALKVPRPGTSTIIVTGSMSGTSKRFEPSSPMTAPRCRPSGSTIQPPVYVTPSTCRIPRHNPPSDPSTSTRAAETELSWDKFGG